MASVEVPMKVITHECGVVYMVPSWMTAYECPMCAKNRIKEVDQCCDALYDECEAKDRTIRSLRGALTKAKRKAGR